MMGIFRNKNSEFVIKFQPLSMHWDTEDPFIFASHHSDEYPAGNAQQAPPLEMIRGRNLGRDYEKRFGFRMYNGKVVPGFPLHAHMGYEVVSIAEKGFIDHFDSLGNKGRYGFGDIQWLSAGTRYHHCEMYPLAFSDKDNPNDITQIMINLPKTYRTSKPRFEMMWSESVPLVKGKDEKGKDLSVKVIVGKWGEARSVSPIQHSWAADPKGNVRILKIVLSPGARVQMSRVASGINRNLYFTKGGRISMGDVDYGVETRLKLVTDRDFHIINGEEESEIWLLEGSPIGEKYYSFGPVIANDEKSVRSAMNEIRENEIKDWRWGIVDKTNPPGTKRFVEYSDGTVERP